MKEGSEPDIPTTHTSDPNERILLFSGDGMFPIISGKVEESEYSYGDVGFIVDLFQIPV